MGTAWRQGGRYAVRGLKTLRLTPLVFVAIMALFSLPAAGVIAITAADLPEGLGRTAGTTVLNVLSGTVAPVMFMKAVAAAHDGRRLGLWWHLADGTRWLPRYIWTNLHTTVIFWVPVGILTVGLISFQRLTFAETFPGGLISILWVVVIGGTGIYVHSRTLLAPFIAVHGNVPGSLAALESWRVSGRMFGPVFATFVIAAGPIAVPLAAVFMGFYLTLPRSGAGCLYRHTRGTSVDRRQSDPAAAGGGDVCAVHGGLGGRTGAARSAGASGNAGAGALVDRHVLVAAAGGGGDVPSAGERSAVAARRGG